MELTDSMEKRKLPYKTVHPKHRLCLSNMKILLVAGLMLILIASSTVASTSKIVRVRSDISSLGSGLDLFKLEVGRYPTTEEGLAALVSPSTIENASSTEYIKKLPKDPWGYEYEYRFPGARNKESFDLWSNGADGLPGGEGFDSDMGNWPGGFATHQAAMSAARMKRIFDVLPITSLIGVIFSGTIYLGICMLRLSDGVQRRKSFTGKSIWIWLAFFVLYWIVALPLIQ